MLTISVRIAIVFVSAPAEYFMYYLSAYLCSYVISAVVIFEMISKLIAKKILKLQGALYEI